MPGVSISSKIITGLPNLPADGLPKELWPEFLTIYRAIQNLLEGVTRWTGIDGPDELERAEMQGYEFLLEQQMASWYPVATVPIARGQLVCVNGANTCGLASAAAMATNAIGVADETVGAGQKVKVITQGLVDSITGMVPGTLYYTGVTPGAIQNLPPITPGQIVQGMGWALDSTHLLLRPSTFIRQL